MTTATPPATTDAARWSPRLWGTLVVLCAALFLDALDVSMVGVALPSIRTDLHLSTASLQWVVSGYVLGYGGLLLLGGRAADLLGRRRVFLTALAVFAVASLLGGLVDDGGLLIATRFVKGVAAAFTAPAGLSIITTTFPEGHERNRALSIYTTCGASGFSLGLVLSGLLTEVGWRWTFLMPFPLALAALAVGSRLIPRQARPERDGRGYDLAGAVTATGGLLLLVYTVTQAQGAGWGSTRTVLSLVLVAALFAAFVAIEQRTAHPLVRLGILRNGLVARANLGALACFGAYVGFQFVATLYLQSLLGWSALQMALAFLPAGVLVAASATKMGTLVDRYGTTRLMLVGFPAALLGYANFLRIGAHGDYLTVILPSMVLLGVHFALVFPSLNIQATSGVADEEQGLASGLVNTAFQVGGATVLAVVTAVVTAGATSGGAGAGAHAQLGGYRNALAVVTGVALIGLLVTATGALLDRRRAARIGYPVPDYAVPAGAAPTGVPSAGDLSDQVTAPERR
ncbi:EmrB/QacA subfamily drug resistance transporter [Streptacidiphilus sp. MAP12-16]|uniref:MFS transporter n=1 Tax=Streptacidiphilus sp. MAP12-16 TaxID=3156300 RepID=UPI003513EB74